MGVAAKEAEAARVAAEEAEAARIAESTSETKSTSSISSSGGGTINIQGETKHGVLMPTDLKDSPFKTLLIIGKTGTGKSALCNRIAGHDFDSDIFPVSGD